MTNQVVEIISSPVTVTFVLISSTGFACNIVVLGGLGAEYLQVHPFERLVYWSLLLIPFANVLALMFFQRDTGVNRPR